MNSSSSRLSCGYDPLLRHSHCFAKHFWTCVCRECPRLSTWYDKPGLVAPRDAKINFQPDACSRKSAVPVEKLSGVSKWYPSTVMDMCCYISYIAGLPASIASMSISRSFSLRRLGCEKIFEQRQPATDARCQLSLDRCGFSSFELLLSSVLCELLEHLSKRQFVTHTTSHERHRHDDDNLHYRIGADCYCCL